jgi:hypothetical protein
LFAKIDDIVVQSCYRQVVFDGGMSVKYHSEVVVKE